MLWLRAQATIYKCRPGGAIDVVQAYADEDVSVSNSLAVSVLKKYCACVLNVGQASAASYRLTQHRHNTSLS